MKPDRIAQLRDWVRIHGNTGNPCEECLDEIESLQAVVSKLPVTADGVPVVPGMKVWCWVPAHFGQPQPYILQSSVLMENGPCRPWADCFSTEQAAKEASHGS